MIPHALAWWALLACVASFVLVGTAGITPGETEEKLRILRLAEVLSVAAIAFLAAAWFQLVG